jgi:hypothetical protein
VRSFFVSIFICVAAIANESSPYDWKFLNELIDRKNITTIEDLLPELPQEIRAEYVLMHTSRSLQGATFQAPRAILHWDSAKKIMSFNGGPEQKGGSSIEMIQFNEDTRKFEFHRLDFEKDKPPIRDQNLKRCHHCHRQDARPNWEHYFVWPGAYGEDDDSYNQKEVEEINVFIQNSKTHPRYKNLINIEQMSPQDGPNRAAKNIPFTQRVYALNSRRVARLVSETPDYQKFKYAAIGGMYCADKFSDFYPDNQKPPATWDTKGEFDIDNYTAKFRYVFESRDIKVDDWFMNFKADPKTNMFTMPAYAQATLAGALAFYDDDFKSYVNVVRDDYRGSDGLIASDINCKALAEKSVEVLGASF